MGKNFLRRGWYRYSKLGKGRRKKLKWRAPLGRHGKMREKRGGADKTVSIGYGKKDRIKFNIIKNLNDLKKELKEAFISRKIGKKKRIEIEKKAKEIGVKILN